MIPLRTSKLAPKRSNHTSKPIIAITIRPKNSPALKASSIKPQPESENMRNKHRIGKDNFFMGLCLETTLIKNYTRIDLYKISCKECMV